MRFSIAIPLTDKGDSIRGALNAILDRVDLFAGGVEIVIVDSALADNSLVIVNQALLNHRGHKAAVNSVYSEVLTPRLVIYWEILRAV
jgi:hypothetical protein